MPVSSCQWLDLERRAQVSAKKRRTLGALASASVLPELPGSTPNTELYRVAQANIRIAGPLPPGAPRICPATPEAVATMPANSTQTQGDTVDGRGRATTPANQSAEVWGSPMFCSNSPTTSSTCVEVLAGCERQRSVIALCSRAFSESAPAGSASHCASGAAAKRPGGAKSGHFDHSFTAAARAGVGLSSSHLYEPSAAAKLRQSSPAVCRSASGEGPPGRRSTMKVRSAIGPARSPAARRAFASRAPLLRHSARGPRARR
mmetsp:Transcript_175378/g.562599  ORF Transcript_175378/g.562599 Transcript_175378/m.562599 type:complete len:261 (-) Transcript_175378:108-890(-)